MYVQRQQQYKKLVEIEPCSSHAYFILHLHRIELVLVVKQLVGHRHRHAHAHRPHERKQAVLFSPGAFRESDPLIRAFCSAVLEQEEIVRRVRIVLVPKQSGEAERSDLSEHADFLERILLLVTMTLFLASNEPGVWDREAFAQSDIGIHPAVLKKIYDRSEEIRLL